jgi:hypothetical protein
LSVLLHYLHQLCGNLTIVPAHSTDSAQLPQLYGVTCKSSVYRKKSTVYKTDSFIAEVGWINLFRGGILKRLGFELLFFSNV